MYIVQYILEAPNPAMSIAGSLLRVLYFTVYRIATKIPNTYTMTDCPRCLSNEGQDEGGGGQKHQLSSLRAETPVTPAVKPKSRNTSCQA